jgi:hypothetical protein
MWKESLNSEFIFDLIMGTDFSALAGNITPFRYILAPQSDRDRNSDNRLMSEKLSRLQANYIAATSKHFVLGLKIQSDATPYRVIIAYLGCYAVKVLDQAL